MSNCAAVLSNYSSAGFIGCMLVLLPPTGEAQLVR